METPRLNEFTEDQLRLMLRLAIKEREDISQHVQSVQKYGLHNIMSDSIAQYRLDMETLDMWATQLATAVVQVKTAETIANN
jgi:hypothetical protein